MQKAMLALFSDTANRLLTGRRPQALLGDLFERLTGHLALDLYVYRRLEDDGESLTLQAHGGVLPDPFGVVRVGDQTLTGTVAKRRQRIIVDDESSSREMLPADLPRSGVTAWVCFPLIAEERLLGTLAFGSRRRRRYHLEEVAVMQTVADQIAICLERERLIDELRARRGELADADRRKDEFLAMLAHELRNPLAPVVNALHVIGIEASARGDHLARAHATMDRQVRHLVRLVDDLLDVSRITQGKIELRRERTPLQSVVEHALQLARPAVKAREHTLVVDLPAEPLPVWVDHTRMTQVVANLVHNAAKYTTPRGTITVAVGHDDDEVVVRVKDTGIGIRAEMLPRVFELFVQADRACDRAAGGLGIGLTLVKRLVQMHGGEVRARSEGLGKGSEFILSIPRALSDQDAATATAIVPLVARLQATGVAPRLRILVVEDNADIRETLKELLEIEGHEVTLVEDGNAAVEAAGNGRGHDVALVDIGLPGLDGYGVARKLRDLQKRRGFPRRLFAMTGYGQAEDRRRALEAGFDAHLVKPVDPALLTRLLAAPSQQADG